MEKFNFKEKKVAIVGFGIEGKDLAGFLLGEGAEVFVFDQKEKEELDLGNFSSDKIIFNCGADYLAKGLLGFDYIFRSPGVYPFIPEIVRAKKEGSKVLSAIKIFFELCPGKIIGVTGTKGKGTTATLIYEMLKTSGKRVFLAGNIGTPYLSLLPNLTKDTWVVLELSSFQLIDMDKSPDVAVVLNITQDHLDWHKDLNEYIDAKKNIVRHQNPRDFAVINSDYQIPKSFFRETRAKVIFYSKNKLEDKYKEGLLLKGEHNWENVAASVAVAKILEIGDKDILTVLSTFKGLEHRLELVREVGGVAFYNDSFATGPQPTIAAIKSFSEPETLILGGSHKGLDYSQLGEEISKHKNVQNVILIGEVSPQIKDSLIRAEFSGQTIEMGKTDMEKIVKKAFEVTPKGGVVLLSPAAASFDMFANYKERGKKFKDAVKLLLQR